MRNTPPVRAQNQVHVTVDHGFATNTEEVQDSLALTKRIKELEAEVAKAKSQKPASVNKSSYDQLQVSGPKKRRGKEGKTSHPVPQTHSKSLPMGGFCYRCGEDSHYLQQCTNPVNAALVQQKLVQRHEQRSSPTKVPTPTAHLNLE